MATNTAEEEKKKKKKPSESNPLSSLSGNPFLDTLRALEESAAGIKQNPAPADAPPATTQDPAKKEKPLTEAEAMVQAMTSQTKPKTSTPTTAFNPTREAIGKPVPERSGFLQDVKDKGFSEAVSGYIPDAVKNIAGGYKDIVSSTPGAIAARTAINAYKDGLGGSLGRTIAETDPIGGYEKLGKGAIQAVTPLIQGGVYLAVGDKTPDGKLMEEVVEGDKTKKDIAEGEQMHLQEQVKILSHDLLDLKDKGVTRADTLAELEKRKANLPVSTYVELQKRINAQYDADNTPGPVQNDALKDAVTRNENRKKGQGNNGYVKPETTDPDKNKAMMEAIDDAGKKAFLGFSTPPVWYESDAFSDGLISFGLGILSGQDYATAFKEGSKVFDKKFGIEKRQAHANELYGQGYSKQAIMQWVETGDASVLKKPERYTTDTDDYGYFQQNLQTGKKEYLMSKLDEDLSRAKIAEARAKALKAIKGDGSEDKFASNPQVVIGRETMPGFAGNWHATWMKDIENYPMMDTAGKFSEVFGRESTLGKAMHSFLLERQQKARRDEDKLMQSYGRPLSGGAITQTEWETWAGYMFPRPEDKGDNDALLRKQLTLDIVVRTVTSLGINHIEDPKKRERALVDVIQQARNVAMNLDGYDYSTGYYQLKDGSLYSPYEEAEKLRKSTTQGG